MQMLKSIRFFGVLLLLARPILLTAQSNITSVVNSLNKVIRPIETLKADSSFTDINFLRESLKDKELIALGEVSHGTLEVFDYKDRLVRFMVTELGYRSLAFEADFIAIENIDHFITGKADSIIYLAGTAIMQSNTPMIQWLRSYNKGKSDSDMVHIYGLEVRNYTNIIKNLLKVVPDMELADRQLFESILDRPFNSNLTKPDIKRLNSTINRLQKLNLSDLNMKYIELLSQFVNEVSQGSRASRDVAMANNATWIKDRTRDHRLILWLHNGHVAKTQLYDYLPMGYHLDKKYGPKYYVIASDFNSGKARVSIFVAKNKPMLPFQPYYFPEAGSEKWYEYFFSKTQYKNFILDLKNASDDPLLADFVKQPRNMRIVGSSQIPDTKKLSLSDNFDMIVYFDKTNSL